MSRFLYIVEYETYSKPELKNFLVDELLRSLGSAYWARLICWKCNRDYF